MIVYGYQCSGCNRFFYTQEPAQWKAAEILAQAIKNHLVNSLEDDHETKFDYGQKWSAQMINSEIKPLDSIPSGAYRAEDEL